MPLTITSSAFEEGATIPSIHTCDAKDISPALSWTDATEATAGFALICDDPDAPVGTWVHWVVVDLPADARGLPEEVPKTDTLESGAVQGRNDFGRIGYGGPCPPRGPAHRYFFKLYALDTRLDLKPGVRKQEVVKAMEGHILAEAQLMGLYSR